MMSSQKVEEFRRLMKEEWGIELSYEEAEKRASELINLYRILMGPIPEDPEAQSPKRPNTSRGGTDPSGEFSDDALPPSPPPHSSLNL